MYRGINLEGIRIASYETALAALEQCSTKRRARFTSHNDWSLGHPKAEVTGISKRDTGDIHLRLYETDVVVWHPDNSFTVHNYGTKTTGEFAAAVLPAGISLCHDVSRPAAGIERENRAIIYWQPGENRWSEARVVNGEDLVTFYPTEAGGWAPRADEVSPFEFFAVDMPRARELCREYHLKDFAMWLSMAPMHMSPRLCWIEDDPGACRQALLERDFRSAAMLLPLVSETRAFGLELKPYPIDTLRGKYVTPTSLQRFKDALYDDEGALVRTTILLPTQAEWQNRSRRRSALEKSRVYL